MCVAATARRVRRNMKLDKRYKSWRKDANTAARKLAASIAKQRAIVSRKVSRR